MEISEAKGAHSREWAPKVSKYNLSCSDSFTDGFWAGRLWAAARVLKACPELDRARVIELLSIYDREAKAEGI